VMGEATKRPLRVSNIAHFISPKEFKEANEQYGSLSFLRRKRDLLPDRAVAIRAHISHCVATSAAGAPIGQFDVKRLRHFRYTRRHGPGIFAVPETSR
jgi:hypothetical protein